MKKIIFLAIIGTYIIYGQTDSLDILRYYPMQVGNKWLYEQYNYFDEFDGYFTVEIIGDTIMPNGKTYFIFSPYMSRFERIDTTNLSVNLYITQDNRDTVKFPLNIFELDTTPSYLGIMEEYKTGIGKVGKIPITKPYKYFKYESGTFIDHYTLSKDIGLSSLTLGKVDMTRYYESNRYLVAATIGDSTYGDFTEIKPENNICSSYKLYQNYPNPFNSTTKIKYRISVESFVNITIFDVCGRQVEIINNRIQYPGEYEYIWNAEDLSSGIYLIQMTTDDYSFMRKCLILK